MQRRLLPSLEEIIFAVTLLFLFLFGQGGSVLLGDSDTGWHIRTGQWILQHLAVPRQDLFSFSKPGGEWFAWEWLSDVLFALAHRYAGLAGVVLLAGLLIALTYALLYRFMARRGTSALLAAALALLAACAGSLHWLARPHLFGWVLALVFYQVLDQTPAEHRSLFWLAPLTVLWTNLHASFVMGLFLVACYGAGELLRAVFAAGEDAFALRRRSLARASRYGLLLAACSAASLLNPYFFRLHAHILAYLRNGFVLTQVSEFLPPNLHSSPARFFEVLLLAGVASIAWALGRGRYAEALLVIAFAHLSLQSARYVPLFAILAAPLIGSALTEVVRARHTTRLPLSLQNFLAGFEEFSAEMGQMDHQPRWHALPVLATGLVALLLWSPATARMLPGFHAAFDPKVFPVAAADYLEETSFAGNVFSTDQWSSYLIYRDFPRVRVFLDGRTDYYGEQVAGSYRNVLAARQTWEQTLEQYRVDAAVLPADSRLAAAMQGSARWKATYHDSVAVVFDRVADVTARSAGTAVSRAKQSKEALR